VLINITKLSCPLCGFESKILAYGVLAPWIVELTETDIDLDLSLSECKSCELKFFSHRFNEDEMNSLYGNYRRKQYLEIRNRWEPWFKSNENNAYKAQTNSLIENRREFFNKSMRIAGIDIKTLNGCVDFGGDLGQFIPEEIEGEKIVVDYSDQVDLNQSVKVVRTIEEVISKVDLVLCCHVLEHLPEIKPTIRSIASKITQRGYIYIEVPQDSHKSSPFHRGTSYRSWLKFLSFHSKFFILVDFIGGVGRQFFGRLFWFGITKQSEHINYFNKKNLEYLLKSEGFTIVYTSNSDRSLKQGRLRLGRLAIIGQKI
jgi:hypothetical protein